MLIWCLCVMYGAQLVGKVLVLAPNKMENEKIEISTVRLQARAGLTFWKKC